MGLIGVILFLIDMVLACCWPLVLLFILIKIMEIPNLPLWIFYPTCVLILATGIFYFFWQAGMAGGVFGNDDNENS